MAVYNRHPNTGLKLTIVSVFRADVYRLKDKEQVHCALCNQTRVTDCLT